MAPGIAITGAATTRRGRTLRMRWIPALLIATLACASRRAPEPERRPATTPRVLQGAAAVAANRAALRAISAPVFPPCTVTGGSVLTGRVIDDSTGRPLAGVGVSAIPGCIVRTNAAGEYKLGPLGEGRFRIAVDADLYYDWTRPWIDVPALGDASSPEISVPEMRAKSSRCTDAPHLAYVRGVIVDDSTGHPIEGVQAGLLGTRCGGVTLADGRFAITAPPARYTLTARRIGYAVIESELDLAAGDTTELHVRMRRAEQMLRTGPLLPVPERRSRRPPADSARSP